MKTPLRKHTKSGWWRAVVAICSSCLLTACATSPVAAPPLARVAVLDLASEDGVADPVLIRELARLDLAIASFPPAGLARQRWRQQAGAVERLARYGHALAARKQLARLQLEVQRDTQAYHARHARSYLREARQFAFLGESELAQLRRLQLDLERGDDRQAYHGGQALVRRLWTTQAWLTVRQGDTLASLAGRSEVYDNPRLWPLLQQANVGLLRDPRRLKPGWRLRYPRYPRLTDVFAAVERAVAMP